MGGCPGFEEWRDGELGLKRVMEMLYTVPIDAVVWIGAIKLCTLNG